MNKQRSLTLNGFTALHALHLINSFAILGVCTYLTIHYFEVKFPVTLGGSDSLCNLSSFWNCDAATHSKASALFGVPISFMGILIAIYFLVSSLFPSKEQEATGSFLAKLNFAGCVVLFFYSLFSLGSLCPFCSVYYLLSGLAVLLYAKFGINSFSPSIKPFAIWGVFFVLSSAGMSYYTSQKEETFSKLNVQIVEQFKKLPDLGKPDVESEYLIHDNELSFDQSPIRIMIFSDFQCPFCKVVSDQMHVLARRYKKDIHIKYYFYPLDNACNPQVQSRFHDKACKAAYLAACDVKQFLDVHDEIFENQEKLNNDTLDSIARKRNLLHCFEDSAVKEKVSVLINQFQKYNIKSTPTIILNGKKIEGTIPNSQFEAIFDYILSNK